MVVTGFGQIVVGADGFVAGNKSSEVIGRGGDHDGLAELLRSRNLVDKVRFPGIGAHVKIKVAAACTFLLGVPARGIVYNFASFGVSDVAG